MHYRVDGYVIRSENAAKPATLASRYVVSLLQEFCPIGRALDFGCGKLRYSVHLQMISQALTLVDSEIQLSRRQVICDRTTSIREFAVSNWPGVRVLNHLEFRRPSGRFDFILCANVLSAVPHRRTRRQIVSDLADRLNSRGMCLFVCQYTNSYFFEQMADRTVRKYADGFIKGRPQNASFYGLIRPEALRKLVEACGMRIAKGWVDDQSAYVIATRK